MSIYFWHCFCHSKIVFISLSSRFRCWRKSCTLIQIVLSKSVNVMPVMPLKQIVWCRNYCPFKFIFDLLLVPFYLWRGSNPSVLCLFPGDTKELPGPLRRDFGLAQTICPLNDYWPYRCRALPNCHHEQILPVLQQDPHRGPLSHCQEHEPEGVKRPHGE